MKIDEHLFRQNNHSMWQVATMPGTETEISLVAEVACAFFPEHTPLQSDVLCVNEGAKSRNFIVTDSWSQKKERVVYRTTALSDMQELERLASLLQYLSEKGISVPKPLPSSEGKYTLEVKGLLWQRYEYVPGDHFQGTVEELRQSAGEIARMHRALALFPTVSFPVGYGTLDPKEWERAFKKMNTGAVSMLVQEKSAPLLRLLDEMHASLQVLPQEIQNEQIIHTDLHPHNFLFSKGTLTAIIDFGNARVGILGSDVAMASHRLVRQVLVREGKLSGNMLKATLWIFLDEYCAENPSFSKAVPYVPLFMRELLLRKIGEVLLDHADGKRGETNSAAEIKKFLLLLEEVSVIEQCF